MALGNSILRNSSSECQNQDQHSFIARTNTDWNSLANGVIEKQSVEAVCEIGRQVPSLKTLTPENVRTSGKILATPLIRTQMID